MQKFNFIGEFIVIWFVALKPDQKGHKHFVLFYEHRHRILPIHDYENEYPPISFLCCFLFHFLNFLFIFLFIFVSFRFSFNFFSFWDKQRKWGREPKISFDKTDIQHPRVAESNNARFSSRN